MKTVLLFLIIICSKFSNSQFLEVNNVRASMGTNMGVLFLDTSDFWSPMYAVPKDSNEQLIYASSLWCSAIDDTGGLHVAAMNWGMTGNDFFSGPFSTTNSYSDSNYVNTYGLGKWFVEKSDIQFHLNNYWQAGYIMSPNIKNWPGNGISGVGVAQNLAPFVDNNNNGIYEPTLGEYPEIRGDGAYYIIMNDAASSHTESGGAPLGIEVHILVYQNISSDYLNNTTFLNYRIFNRGNNNYSNFKVSIWSDLDVGFPGDDYIGCDVTNNMMYAYNGNNNDGWGLVLGINPPAIGITALNKSMVYCATFSNGFSYPYIEPTTSGGYYNLMNGKWVDGTQIFYGGSGVFGSIGSTSIPAKYMFPGDSDPLHVGTSGIDPAFFWDEFSSMNNPSDKRSIMTVEDVVLNPGDNECYDFAILYSREPGNNHLQNVTSLRTQAALAKTDFDAMTSYNCNQITLGLEKQDEIQFGIYPNPTSSSFTLSFGQELISGVVKITDMNGRILIHEILENVNSKSFVLNVESGVYQVSIQTVKGIVRKKVLLNN